MRNRCSGSNITRVDVVTPLFFSLRSKSGTHVFGPGPVKGNPNLYLFSTLEPKTEVLVNHLVNHTLTSGHTTHHTSLPQHRNTTSSFPISLSPLPPLTHNTTGQNNHQLLTSKRRPISFFKVLFFKQSVTSFFIFVNVLSRHHVPDSSKRSFKSLQELPPLSTGILLGGRKGRAVVQSAPTQCKIRV